MTDEEAKTFEMQVGDRMVAFRQPAIGQLLILQRRAHKARSQADKEADPQIRADKMMQLIASTLDVIESLIVSPEDVEHVEEAMLLGKIDYSDLMDALAGGIKETKEAKKKATPAKKTVAKAVTRGRTKR